MSTALIVGSRTAGSVSASNTLFPVVATGGPHANGSATIEANATIPYRQAGIFSKMFIRVSSNDRATSTLTFRVGAADVTQTISITGSTTGEFADNSHTDTITSGNQVNYKLVTGSGGTSFVPRVYGVLFYPTDGVTTLEKLGSYFNVTCAGTNTFHEPLTGAMSNAAAYAEANMQLRCKVTSTLRNLYLFIATNTIASTSTAKSRVGSADGAIAASITASTTGAFEDSSNSDSLSANALINWDLVAAAAGNLLVTVFGCDLVNNLGAGIGGTASATGTVINASVTDYFCHSGQGVASTTESDYQTNPRINLKLSDIEIFLTANTVSAASTFKSRVGAANGAMSASITSSTTGRFSDNTNSDNVVDGSEVDVQLITGATGTSMTIGTFQMSTTNQKIKHKVIG